MLAYCTVIVVELGTVGLYFEPQKQTTLKCYAIGLKAAGLNTVHLHKNSMAFKLGSIVVSKIKKTKSLYHVILTLVFDVPVSPGKKKEEKFSKQ